jgi:multimeric flavodoxin WrbA
MKALVISDAEYRTGELAELEAAVDDFLEQKGFEVRKTVIDRETLTFCMGCFGCWVKKPGECVIDDGMTGINRDSINSDTVFYLSPVVFGQFSPNIKNAVDRWIPNILPFFKSKPGGLTVHPSRYDAYPSIIIIGYGDGLSEEDARLFTDITHLHRKNGQVLIYRGDKQKFSAALNTLALEKVGGNV